MEVTVGSGGELEGVLVITYTLRDGTAQTAVGDGDEHGWVDQVQLPDGAEITRLSSGYQPPMFTLFEDHLQLIRRLEVDLPGDAIDDTLDAVRDGDVIDGLDLRVESETGDGPDDSLSVTLRTPRDDQVRVSFFPGSVDGGYRMSLDATIELTDLELGTALEDAPEPDVEA